MGKVKLADIKNFNYEGYLWMSDEKSPRIIRNETVDLPQEDQNPFIAEGQLFSAKERKSYSIKYVDGEYFVQEFDVPEADVTNSDNQVKIYLSNRMGGKKMKFLRYWEERPADIEGIGAWPVLTQTKNVFIGFVKEEDAK